MIYRIQLSCYLELTSEVTAPCSRDVGYYHIEQLFDRLSFMCAASDTFSLLRSLGDLRSVWVGSDM